MDRKIINGIAVIAFIGLVGLLNGCYYDNEQELYPFSSCDTTHVNYSLVVTPIIQNNCYTCHSNAQAANSGNNIRLEGYANLSGYINSNPTVFFDAIKHTGTASPMPKNMAALSSCDIKKIENWVHSGMPNN